MSTVITTICFLLGVAIACLSAVLVTEKRQSVLWYVLPTVYVFVTMTVEAKINNRTFDFFAAVFFSAAITLIGWGSAKVGM